jgi:RNA-directed DNA polymerase
LGYPVGSLKTGRLYQPQEGQPKTGEESDQLTVLGGGKADHKGKGLAGTRSLQRKHHPDKKGWKIMMQTSLEGIAYKARSQRKYRFFDLYRLLNEENLKDSWRYLNKNAAYGIDRVSAREYESNLEGNIRDLVERLKSKRYRAKLIRRKYIPKDNGQQRPLGIPVIEDKLLQCAVTRILQAIWEEEFLPCSYGYRPERGAIKAVEALRKELYKGKYQWVVEADIQGFFDSMEHDWIIKMLEQRIADQAFIGLIRKWLKAGVLETDNTVIHPANGSPQGGVVSPVLANIYMHYALNLWFEKVVKPQCRGSASLWVYADDFVTAFEHQEEAERFYAMLGERLGKFGLRLSEEKTRILRFDRLLKEESGTFVFLGFEFRWVKSHKGKDWLKPTTSKKKFRKSLRNLKEWCKKNRSTPLKQFFKKLNAKLRGYYNYYGVIGNLDGIWKFDYRLVRIVFKWLNRRSQKRSYNWEGFLRMLKTIGLVRPRIIHYGSAGLATS